MKKNLRSRLAFSGVLVTGLMTLAACGGGEAAPEDGEMPAVTIAIPPSIHGLGPAAAYQEDLFEEAGVEVELVQIQSGAEGAALLAGGDAQFALFAMDNAINSVIEGHSNIITVPITQQEPEWSEDPHGIGSIIVDPTGDIETLKDLEGEQIGTSALNSEAYLNAYQVLENAGVDVSTIEWIQIPGPQHISAVRQGQVAAAITPEPNLSVAILAEEIQPLAVASGVLPNAPMFGLASDTEWVEENPEVVEAVQSAVLEANKRLNADREFAEGAIREYMGLEDDVVSLVRMPTFPEEQFSVDSLEQVAQRLVEFELLAEEDVSVIESVLYEGK